MTLEDLTTILRDALLDEHGVVALDCSITYCSILLTSKIKACTVSEEVPITSVDTEKTPS